MDMARTKQIPRKLTSLEYEKKYTFLFEDDVLEEEAKRPGTNLSQTIVLTITRTVTDQRCLLQKK